jgi:hypothetical protein
MVCDANHWILLLRGGELKAEKNLCYRRELKGMMLKTVKFLRRDLIVKSYLKMRKDKLSLFLFYVNV